MKPFLITSHDKNYKLLESGYVLEEDCNHEEADTRLIHLTVKESSCHAQDVVVVSKDTDVLILLIWAFSKYDIKSKWYLKYENDKYADIGKIAEHFGTDISADLPAFHGLTGCDTTSYFFRIGKVRVFKKLIKKCSKLELLGVGHF